MRTICTIRNPQTRIIWHGSDPVSALSALSAAKKDAQIFFLKKFLASDPLSLLSTQSAPSAIRRQGSSSMGQIPYPHYLWHLQRKKVPPIYFEEISGFRSLISTIRTICAIPNPQTRINWHGSDRFSALSVVSAAKKGAHNSF